MLPFQKIFKMEKPVIGMVHVHALPGTPKNTKTISEIIEIALADAKIYQNESVDGIMLENMHDIPYLNRKVGSEIIASMTAIAMEIKKIISIPCGIQILAGANKEALAVAQAADLDFIRAEGFIFSHIADEGFMDACAGELLRYRKKIGAEDIPILTDIKKKHSSHTISSDISITEMAKSAEFFLSDGIIISGKSTSEPANLEEIKQVKAVTKLPVVIGSGLTLKNIENYWNYADGFIVGSYFKKNGFWENSVSKQRVCKFMEKVKKLTRRKK